MEWIIVELIIAAFLGIIPGKIAENKGHSFWKWWFYGWMLFIVAVLHVQFIEDYINPTKKQDETAILDELERYHQLYLSGGMTRTEYEKKKRDLLGL